MKIIISFKQALFLQPESKKENLLPYTLRVWTLIDYTDEKRNQILTKKEQQKERMKKWTKWMEWKLNGDFFPSIKIVFLVLGNKNHNGKGIINNRMLQVKSNHSDSSNYQNEIKEYQFPHQQNCEKKIAVIE